MSIVENLQFIRNQLPENVKLVAVSKTKSIAEIMDAYNAGQRCFGENKVQELLTKQLALPSDIEWHFIGHLQTNKVKQLAPFVSLVHGVDSLKLLSVLNNEAKKLGRKIPLLLEFHIAREESKFGLTLPQAEALIRSCKVENMEHVQISGVMGMATFTDDEKQIRAEFDHLRNIFLTLKENYFFGEVHFNQISMGMSDDYLLAVAAGSTLVRIGSRIFGSRTASVPN